MEEREIVRVSEINLFLASLDVLELDLVSLVDTSYRRRGDLYLTKPPVEHLSSLCQGQVSALLESCGGDQVSYMILGELRSGEEDWLETM